MRDYSQEDRRVRERLQKQSGADEGRSNLLGKLAALAAVDAFGGRDIEGVLDGLRRMAQTQPAIARGHNQRHDARMARRRHRLCLAQRMEEDMVLAPHEFRKRTKGRYENDADNQNSRNRDHQSRF